jgi:hypothetical protein
MTGDYDCTTGTAPRRLVAPPAHQQLGRSQLSGRHSRLTLRFVTSPPYGLSNARAAPRSVAAGRASQLRTGRYLDQVQVPCWPRGDDRLYTTTNGAFRSLIAGVYRDGKLVEVGRVGTGFGRDKVARILPKLQARWRPPRALFLAKPRREGWGNPLGAPGVGGGDRV